MWKSKLCEPDLQYLLGKRWSDFDVLYHVLQLPFLEWLLDLKSRFRYRACDNNHTLLIKEPFNEFAGAKRRAWTVLRSSGEQNGLMFACNQCCHTFKWFASKKSRLVNHHCHFNAKTEFAKCELQDSDQYSMKSAVDTFELGDTLDTILDEPCTICRSDEDEENCLICDGCNLCMHSYCIALDAIPEGCWYCPWCSSNQTVDSKEVWSIFDFEKPYSFNIGFFIG